MTYIRNKNKEINLLKYKIYLNSTFLSIIILKLIIKKKKKNQINYVNNAGEDEYLADKNVKM